MSQKGRIIFSIAILLLVGVRFFGTDIPYHQDEYKAAFSISTHDPGGAIKHPPLNEGIYVLGNALFGNANLRFVPLSFFILSLLALFYYVRKKFDEKTAWWSVSLYSLSFYSVLASLMVDVDGAVMPFFVILLFLFYENWLVTEKLNGKKLWGVLILAVTVTGLLIKFTFGLALIAIVADFLISKKKSMSRKDLIKYFIYLLTSFILVALIAWSIRFVVPSLDIIYVFKDWGHRFFSGAPRNYLQIFIQSAKAVMYLSPLLVLLPFLVKKIDFPTLRQFFFFVFAGLFFYLVAFDFSSGTLDRYLQFLILPLSVIGAFVISQVSFKETKGKTALLSIALVILIGWLNFIYQAVPPLYPKTEWLSRLFSFNWNFLFPFTGGSGPVGFYVSVLFVAICFLSALALVIAAKASSKLLPATMVALLSVSVLYNVVFTEEYVFGAINGNPSSILKDAEDFIASDNKIDGVVTYNDIGTYELSNMNKRKQRLYVAPQFEEGNKETLAQNRYHLVVNIPRLNPTSFQARFFDSCEIIFNEQSGQISSRVYDCLNGDKNILQ